MSGFERWSVWVSAALTTVTGIGLLWTKYFLDASEPWSVVNHPLQPWLLKAHIVTAPLLVFAIGLIALRHVWKHFRNGVHWGRHSGIMTGLVTVPMIVSGYLIQAVTHVTWLQVIAISHIVLGFVFAIGLSLHQLFVSRRSRVAETAADRSASSWPGSASPLGQASSQSSPPARASSPAEASASRD